MKYKTLNKESSCQWLGTPWAPCGITIMVWWRRSWAEIRSILSNSTAMLFQFSPWSDQYFSLGWAGLCVLLRLTTSFILHWGCLTKWLTFCRWYFQIHFLNKNFVPYYSIDNKAALVCIIIWCWTGDTSNGSWCIGIKGEMSGTVCVTFTWDIYIYIYELFIAFVCFVVCSLL